MRDFLDSTSRRALVALLRNGARSDSVVEILSRSCGGLLEPRRSSPRTVACAGVSERGAASSSSFRGGPVREQEATTCDARPRKSATTSLAARVVR
jgi:hypothetical protein